MQKTSTKPAPQTEKKTRSIFSLSPTELKAVVGGGGVVLEGPRR